MSSNARNTLLLAIVSLAFAMTTGCSGLVGGGGGNNGDDNNGQACEYECFADYRCEGGIVYEKEGGPIPCSQVSNAQEAAQVCADRPETEFRTCADGCRTDVDNIGQYPSYTSELCAEDRLAQPGDSCSDDSDCRPTDVGVGPMECEQSSGTCIDPNAPEDAGMNADAGDAGDEDVADEDTTDPEDTETEDTVEDTQTEDVEEDTRPEDTQTDDTQTDDTQDDDTQSGDTQTGDATNDDATD